MRSLRHIGIVAAVVAAGIVACASPERHVGGEDALGALQLVEYTHASNWPATHPSRWTIRIDSTGNAMLTDSVNGMAREQAAWAGEAVFNRLREQVGATSFTTLREHYSDSVGKFSETQQYVIRLQFEHGEQSVTCDPGREPTSVWMLQHVLADIKASSRWHSTQ